MVPPTTYQTLVFQGKRKLLLTFNERLGQGGSKLASNQPEKKKKRIIVFPLKRRVKKSGREVVG